MWRPRNLSLRQKLTGIIVLTSTAGILLACTVFAIYDIVTFRRTLANDLETIAQITGSNSTAALTFGDAQSAREILGSLRAKTHIVEACIYTIEGNILATYQRRGSIPEIAPHPPGGDQTSIGEGRIILFRQIRMDGEVAGTIYLKSDLKELHAVALRSAGIMAAVILDLLTGISNRGGVLDALGRERSRQIREGGSFGIVLADIDHFKWVNDAHGHLVGDAVLKEAARMIAACIRPYDTLGRYGGEEFLIVVPSSDSAGTMGLAERIRKTLASQSITTSIGPVQITASLGVAVSGEGLALDPQVLLHLADEALYCAKHHGRNRSELAAQSKPGVSGMPVPESAPVPSESS